MIGAIRWMVRTRTAGTQKMIRTDEEGELLGLGMNSEGQHLSVCPNHPFCCSEILGISESYQICQHATRFIQRYSIQSPRTWLENLPQDIVEANRCCGFLHRASWALCDVLPDVVFGGQMCLRSS